MAHIVTAAASPLNCFWVQPGSRRSIEGFEYAVCQRVPDAERVVNEAECAYCPSWEPPRCPRSGQPARNGRDASMTSPVAELLTTLVQQHTDMRANMRPMMSKMKDGAAAK